MRKLFALLFLGVLNVQVAFAANPTLTLRKVVQNNSAGTAVATQWTLSAVGPNGLGGFVGLPVGTPTDASLGPISVAPARYFLGETGPGGVYLPGYSAQIDLPSFSFWACTGGGVQDRNSITLAADEVVTCTITNVDTPDPDLPGVLANLESIPSGSLIIPMDSALQIDGANNDAEDAFNLTAYGLVNKLLQNNIPVKWAIRADKIKIVGDATLSANSATTLTDTTKNFVTLGVQVGDLVTNVSNDFTRSRVTAVGTTTLTVVGISGDPVDFDPLDDYVIDFQDFTATAERIRPGVDVPAAPTAFAGGPFIVSSEFPTIIAKALEIIDGIDDGVPPVLPQFDDNASQLNVRVYRTTAITNNVDVRYNLTHKPFVAVSDFNTDIHADVLIEAGIPGATPDGKNYINCTPLPGQPGFDPNACNWVEINPVNLSALECATVHYEPHRDGQAAGFTIDDIGDAVENFVTGGGNMFVQCHGVEYFENHDVRIDPDEQVQGVYMTTLGVSKQGNGARLTYPHPELAIHQMTGPLDGAQGGSVPDWLIPDGGSYKNNGYIGAQGFGVASNIHTAAAGKAPTGSGLGGNVFYLGGHSYDGDDLDIRNGRRMLLNAMFIPPDRPAECGLTINGSLILVKEVVNDDGGTADVDDFLIETDAGTLLFDAGVTVGDTTTYTAETLTVLAGQPYSLAETDLALYSEGLWSCEGGDDLGGGAFDSGTVTLQPGDTKTCTITNDDIAQNPDISIDKEGALDLGVDGIANPGDIITYQFSVSNTGDTTLTSVAVTDPLVGLSAIDCSPEANPIASIAAGADPVLCTATYAITQADIDAGLRDNEATATGQCTVPIECPVTDSDPNQETIPQSPAVTIDKEGTFDQGADATSTVGDIISYTFDVTNTGNMTLTNVAVTDPLITDPPNSGTITCPSGNPIPTMAPGATEQCTATYAITQADIDAGSRDNTGTVTGDCTLEEDCPVTDDDPETVEIPTDSSIDLIKTLEAPAVLQPDGSYTVLYTIQAVNSGNALGTYDLVDTFSPGSGITLNSATALYSAGTENSQTGTLGAYPNFVTGETLAAGLDESWEVTANFDVDPADVDPADSQCDPAEPVIDTGFYNAVTGVTDEEDTTNNDTCTDLPPPDINLAKTLVGPATLEADGTYTVEYTITATNNGDGPGYYDLVDTFSPAAGITLNEATALYVAGTENSQTGTTGDYPNFVTGEALAASLNESWTVTANFTVDPALLVDADRLCDPAAPVINTGFYNAVSGVDQEADTTDNDTCTDLPPANINLAKTVNGPAVVQPDDTYTVVYTITATNNGTGPGSYDLVDAFSPAAGITLNTATALYVAGTENSQTGTLGAYPNFVTGEGLAGSREETWTVTANFTVDPAVVDPATAECSPASPVISTGFYNAVSGVVDEEDTTDNDTCTGLEPPVIRTTFRVIKDFTDDNPAHVEVEISCFTGLPLIQTQEIWEGRDVIFIVGDFDAGELDCEISEVIPEGYSPTYTAEALEGGLAGGITSDDEGCQFSDVESGPFQCSIVNTPDPVDVVIEKVWVIEGASSDVIDTTYKLKLFCDAEIVGGSTYCGNEYANSPEGEPSNETWCKTFYGDGSEIFTAQVIPEYPDSHCYVEETVYDDAVEIDNDCENLVVSAGHGASCVITNTVFFEGIPTLNQYGMAILALLMMGVGLVGFRRFV